MKLAMLEQQRPTATDASGSPSHWRLALVASASTWFYMNRILSAQQIADAAAQNGRPRGNLSDLYPRWLGARELLLHGRNPYSAEITLEIQQGYYGRPIDPARPDDPKDRQGFAYPVYVVFLLAPTVRSPVRDSRDRLSLAADRAGGVSVLLWLRVLRWRTSLRYDPDSHGADGGLAAHGAGNQAAAIEPAGGGIAGGVRRLPGGRMALSRGGLLALATIKPQLAWPLVLWLLLWAVSDWRSRRRFVFGFGLVMLLLLGGAELVLPGWLRMFVEAIGQYHQYTQNQSVLMFLFGSIARAGSRGRCA